MFMDVTIALLEPNGGIGGGTGGSARWVCVGRVPEIDPNKNLWIKMTHLGSGGGHQGAASGGGGAAGKD